MTIPSSPVYEQTLRDYRAYLDNAAAQGAFDVLVVAGKSSTTFSMFPHQQGLISRTVRFEIGDAWPYAFIVNRADLLFYYRRPSGRTGDAVLAALLRQGLEAERNAARELKVRITTESQARAIVADCLEIEAQAHASNGDADETDDEWSEEELRASVAAYRAMQELERGGQRGFKRGIYRDLASRYGRTEKAFEFRMQNISAVLALLGRDWISGLKPRAHVGANVGARIERVIHEVDGAENPARAAFEIAVRKRVEKPPLVPPAGTDAPGKATAATTVFLRDPAVKAWVLRRAKGVCECCSQPAPFESVDGMPFLEVHHVRPLAEKGSDRPSNAVALCPNCHRRLHFGKDAAELRARLLTNVAGLQVE